MSAQPNFAKNRLAILLGLVAVAAVVVVVAILVSGGGNDNKSSSSGGANKATVSLAGIPQSGITLGNANAPVTINEFVDPQCPYCRDFSVNEFPTVVKQAIRTGKAKLELRVLTFIGPDSVTAAHVWEAAGLQNKMFDVAETFYANQGEENSGYVTDAWLKDKLGSIPGFDLDKALADASKPQVNSELGTAKTLASRYGVDSTPTLMVGKTTNDLKKVDSTASAVLAAVNKLAPAGQ
jgi:protein-disulfide isomerase